MAAKASIKGVENAQDNVRKKRKRVSKKSKRSWRKHVDITEIEEHLDEVRRQERTGGIISLKKNQELYYVDKDNDKRANETGEKGDEVVKRKKRKLRNAKGNSSDESSDDETEKAAIIHKNQKNKTGKTGVYDLWASNNDNSNKDDHYLKVTRKKPVKQPKTAYNVRSTAPALAVCHPGASYNPTFEDHQTLLMAACKVEIMKEKEIEKIKKKLQLPSEEEMAKLPSLEEEMKQGLPQFERGIDGEDGDENDGEDGDENDGEGAVLLPSGGNKERKTVKEKRKANKRKKEEQSSQMLRKEKVKENEVFRVKSIKKLMKKDDEKIKQRQEKKQNKEIEASSKPQRLGRQKFEEMNIAIQLSDEVSGSLRNLKPEGNLFEDRFKNLQRRNIIEPRRPIMPHRKYKLKEYEKRSYKNFNLQEKLKQKRKK